MNEIDTVLARDFEGIELSMVQWQRIARGLYRNSAMILLDEPTAAIDPLEELELYTEFSNICKSKTAIIVTHRLSLAQIADCILVLKNGEIVERGTHKELMNLYGEYYKMFKAQSKWYV